MAGEKSQIAIIVLKHVYFWCRLSFSDVQYHLILYGLYIA